MYLLFSFRLQGLTFSSLSTKVCLDELAQDLKKVFTQFGPCHVKIKQDKKKGLPGAFVQFEVMEPVPGSRP